MKRHRSPTSPGEGNSRTKLSKTSSNNTRRESQTKPSLEHDREIRISVTLRSRSKAARNDPKPPLTDEDWRRIFQQSMRRPSTGENCDEGNNKDSDDEADNSDIPGSDDEEDDDDGDTTYGDDDDSDAIYGDEDDSDARSSDDGLPWYEEIDGCAVSEWAENVPTAPVRANRRAIGHCDAKLIRRCQMRESFWLEMDSPLQGTHDLAFDLFDRYGRLDREFYEHDFRKGTGVWGNELDHGDLLLFDLLKVDSDYRRQGIGTKLVNAILEKTRKKVSESEGFFALVVPGFLWEEMPGGDLGEWSRAKRQALQASLAFWHSLGFRRVGTSSWLARTDSPDHPSRHLETAQDWKCPETTGDVAVSDELRQIFEKLANPAVEEAECIDELAKTLPEDPEDYRCLTVNEDGDTLLHVAAMSFKPEPVRFIFSKVATLATMRNGAGYTPLEAMRNRLEHDRTRRSNGHRSEVRSDAFTGFSALSIECFATLENTTAFDLSTLSPRDIEAASSATDEQVRSARQVDIAGIRKTLRYKYGCTCGQCIGGFLSPRMKFALLCVAEVNHDMINDDMDESGPDWVERKDYFLTHLPDSVRQNLKTNKSMRQGFANMCDHFADCLRRGRIPTESEVLGVYRQYKNEWPPVTRTYLQRGGTVAAVADMIFEKAMEEDEWAGDGGHREVFGEKIEELVACRNDHEFGFVGGMCGYKRVRPVSSRFVDMFGRELDPDNLHMY